MDVYDTHGKVATVDAPLSYPIQEVLNGAGVRGATEAWVRPVGNEYETHVQRIDLSRVTLASVEVYHRGYIRISGKATVNNTQ